MVFIQTVLDKLDKAAVTVQEVVKAFKGDKRTLLADFETMKNEVIRASRKLETLTMEKTSLKASLSELESALRSRSGSRFWAGLGCGRNVAGRRCLRLVGRSILREGRTAWAERNQ